MIHAWHNVTFKHENIERTARNDRGDHFDNPFDDINCFAVREVFGVQFSSDPTNCEAPVRAAA